MRIRRQTKKSVYRSLRLTINPNTNKFQNLTFFPLSGLKNSRHVMISNYVVETFKSDEFYVMVLDGFFGTPQIIPCSLCYHLNILLQCPDKLRNIENSFPLFYANSYSNIVTQSSWDSRGSPK